MDDKTVPAARAAFETTTGARHVLTLSEADVERYLDLPWSVLVPGRHRDQPQRT
jgi:hypothetical protein